MSLLTSTAADPQSSPFNGKLSHYWLALERGVEAETNVWRGRRIAGESANASSHGRVFDCALISQDHSQSRKDRSWIALRWYGGY
jgi:hypothetical protein